MLAIACSELDNGPRTDRSATMRMCAVSREVRPIDELIRFVVSPSGEVVADLKRKLPGRGLWVSASRQAVAEAVRPWPPRLVRWWRALQRSRKPWLGARPRC